MVKKSKYEYLEQQTDVNVSLMRMNKAKELSYIKKTNTSNYGNNNIVIKKQTFDFIIIII